MRFTATHLLPDALAIAYAGTIAPVPYAVRMLLTLPCELLSEEDHCLHLEAFHLGALQIGITQNIFSQTHTKSLYLVYGSTGPTWNNIRVTLPADEIYFRNRCNNLYILASISEDAKFTDIQTAVRIIDIEEGNCMGEVFDTYTGVLPPTVNGTIGNIANQIY